MSFNHINKKENKDYNKKYREKLKDALKDELSIKSSESFDTFSSSMFNKTIDDSDLDEFFSPDKRIKVNHIEDNNDSIPSTTTPTAKTANFILDENVQSNMAYNMSLNNGNENSFGSNSSHKSKADDDLDDDSGDDDNETSYSTSASSSSTCLSSNDDDYFDDLACGNESQNGCDLLYENCCSTVRDFAIAYIYTCQYMKINRQSRDILLGLFRSFLPINNNLPATYSMLVKSLNYKASYETKTICSNCDGELQDDESKCTKQACNNLIQTDINLKSLPTKNVYIFDVEKQIKDVLEKEWSTFLSYTETAQTINNTDICNSGRYIMGEDKITLTLFADSMSLSKSNKVSMWALASSINELPLAVRTSKNNIIIHALWVGSIKDFNNFLENYSGIDNLIENGILINGYQLNVKIHCCLADAPARAKLFNTTQFNGGFGCLHCMHPNKFDKVIRKSYYKYDKTVKTRTHKMYLKQLETALLTKSRYRGVIGRSYISNWIQIPTDSLLDYMHLCLEGTTKWLLDHLLNTNNHEKAFYLGKAIKTMDSRLNRIKFPIEYPRSQRSLVDRKRYKANEYRNFAFYCFITITYELLKANYFDHLLSYIVFLRILCNEEVTSQDREDAEILIHDFIEKFSSLYGNENILYNLHGHLHLVKQVERFGPLNKHSAFAFEGLFKYFRELFHGTRGHVNQICNYFLLDKYIYFQYSSIFKNSHNIELNLFVKQLERVKKKISEQHFYEKSRKIKATDLSNNELKLLRELNCKIDDIVEVDSLESNRLVYHTEKYDSFKKFDCHSVVFETKLNRRSFGCIKRIFKVRNRAFCLIQSYEEGDLTLIKSNSNEKATRILKFHCKRLFVVAKCGNLDLVPAERITGRCIQVYSDNSVVILSPVVLLNEHD